MSPRRQHLLWLILALTAVALLVTVLVWRHRAAPSRWSAFLMGDPEAGARVFQKKGCSHCHAVNGVGGKRAPDLGFERPARSSLQQLVATFWNHAPRMWKRMQELKVADPELSQEEMAHLFAYLYTARYADEPGDWARGRRLFETKNCVHCHALYGVGGNVGPDLSALSGAETPIVWTQAMWNHAPAMEIGMRQLGLDWPQFQGREMNDLLAYVRDVAGGPRRESGLLPANPDRGRQLFETKSCATCHPVAGEEGKVGPELGPRSGTSLTLVQFAGLMWNHSPGMWEAMKARGIPRPTFEGREMADLIAYLYTLRYFEPGGSPAVGQTLFAQRGCSYCHGPRAEGTPQGPALRGRGHSFTAVSLATALWRHGPKMEQRAQELQRPWPTLAEGDIGDLIVFLNSAPVEKQ